MSKSMISPRIKECDWCKGTGVPPTFDGIPVSSPCNTCQGLGWVWATWAETISVMQQESQEQNTCTSCGKAEAVVGLSYGRKDEKGNYIPDEKLCADCWNAYKGKEQAE